MDKYIKALIDQNPKMEVKCNNPSCGYEIKVKTAEFYKNDTYPFVCPKCGKTTEITGINDAKKKIIKQFKDFGIIIN